MPFKDFDAEQAELGEQDPITFKLGGTTFHCVTPIPVGGVITILRDLPDNPSELAQVQVFDRLLLSWIMPEDQDAWTKTVAGLADLAPLQALVEWIMAEVTGRPTPPS